MTIGNTFEYYVKSLSSLYEKNEAESITQFVFEEVLNISKSQLIIRTDETITEVKANDLAWKLMRLMKGEPVQYVLGYAHFFGMKLKVNKSVLIPRPETEELVEWIIEENKKKSSLRILDIGTGSGCIAIALKKKMRDAAVYAIEISEDAIRVAEENARQQLVEIEFIKTDILTQVSDIKIQNFDLV